MRQTLCKLAGCDRKRFQLLRLCYFHWKEREKQKREEKNAKRLARKLASKGHQESQLKLWRKKCWTLMSRWVRLKAADPFTGYVHCYTCTAVKHYKEMDAGHNWHGKLDYDERNLRPQCDSCNRHHSGNRAVYTLNLIRDHGLPWVMQLEKDAAQHKGYTDINELKKIHADLSERLNGMK